MTLVHHVSWVFWDVSIPFIQNFIVGKTCTFLFCLINSIILHALVFLHLLKNLNCAAYLKNSTLDKGSWSLPRHSISRDDPIMTHIARICIKRAADDGTEQRRPHHEQTDFFILVDVPIIKLSSTWVPKCRDSRQNQFLV